jgi:peptide-methionine (S)-S-oxide reductase
MFAFLYLPLLSLSKEMTLEGDQFCSYRPKVEIFDLHASDTLELDKGYECEVCSSQQECKTIKDKPILIPSPEECLTGRQEALQISDHHFVLGTKTKPLFPPGMEMAIFGIGCFWGPESLYWKEPGVYSTQVGYAGGFTPNPINDEVCSGFTGHAEVVRVVYNPEVVSYRKLLKRFWESHDPTQGMRQGVDEGTWYRSMIMVFTQEQRDIAMESRYLYQKLLFKAGLGSITTEIRPASEFYYAEEYNQQYLAKNPESLCELGGTGVELPDSFE